MWFYGPRATRMGHDATWGHRPEIPSLSAYTQAIRYIYSFSAVSKEYLDSLSLAETISKAWQPAIWHHISWLAILNVIQVPLGFTQDGGVIPVTDV